MLVGEIGISPGFFRFGLKWWEVRSIIRGYSRRERGMWSATRWQAYNLMCAFAGSKALSEAGINSVGDLIKFPWDTDMQIISDDDIRAISAEIDVINAQRQKSSEE